MHSVSDPTTISECDRFHLLIHVHTELEPHTFLHVPVSLIDFYSTSEDVYEIKT